MNGSQDNGGVNPVSESSFEREVIASSEPVLVDFWAPGCGPCRRLAPVLEELSARYRGKLSVAKVNVDENEALAVRYGVRSLPALMLFHRTERVDSLMGARTLEDLERFVGRWV